jgi:hypothetical protein
MSMAAYIAKLEGAGKLRRYVPKGRHPPRRRLYLASAAMQDFDSSSSAVNLLVGKGYVEAALTRWVSGNLIYGDHKRGRFLDKLTPPPPEVWEIRITEPVVQARLFCRFAEPDTLILTNLHTRGHLGDKGSQAWTAALAACVQSWDDIFEGANPFSGSNIHSYVTENCHAFPIC